MTVCIVVNGKKFQSQTVTLTLIGQCPMSNLSEDFSYPTMYSNFKILDHLFFELPCLHTDRQTDRQGRQVLYTCGLNRKYNDAIITKCVYGHNTCLVKDTSVQPDNLIMTIKLSLPLNFNYANYQNVICKPNENKN